MINAETCPKKTPQKVINQHFVSEMHEHHVICKEQN